MLIVRLFEDNRSLCNICLGSYSTYSLLLRLPMYSALGVVMLYKCLSYSPFNEAKYAQINRKVSNFFLFLVNTFLNNIPKVL